MTLAIVPLDGIADGNSAGNTRGCFLPLELWICLRAEFRQELRGDFQHRDVMA